jgi:hypothetical protein
VHIRQRTIHILDTFVLFNILAEWAISMFHVGELIFILNEEFATILTLVNCNIRNNVLEVAFGVVRIKVVVILNVYLFEAHCAKHKFIYFDWFVVSSSLLVQKVKELHGEGIIVYVSML